MASFLVTKSLAPRDLCANNTVTGISDPSISITDSNQDITFTIFGSGFTTDSESSCPPASSAAVGGVPCTLSSVQYTQADCTVNFAAIDSAFSGIGLNPFGFKMDVTVAFNTDTATAFSALQLIDNRAASVTNAQFSNDGSVIPISFSAPTDTGGMGYS